MKTFNAIVGLGLLGLTLVNAACPNQCSGHGRCNDVDRCICFTAQGKSGGYREAWTGPDCSQKVCPFGTAFDTIATTTQSLTAPVGWIKAAGRAGGYTPSNTNGFLNVYVSNKMLLDFDMNVDVEVMTAAFATGHWTGYMRWKLDSDADFSKPIAFKSTGNKLMSSSSYALELKPTINGLPKSSGVFVYFAAAANGLLTGLTNADDIRANDRYFFNLTANSGSQFFGFDDNSAHQLVECSGRGSCDRSTGACQCVEGYTGDSCSRTACPNQCSGHGICQDLSRFATEESHSYANAYDAHKMMGCKCDAGYRGSDCSNIECPSGADPMGGAGGSGVDGAGAESFAVDCSGRGICDYTSGVCSCFKGFFGERCESRSNLI